MEEELQENIETSEKKSPIISKVLGEAPGMYTQIAFYIGLILFTLNFIWTVFCLVTLYNQAWISESKHIDVFHLFDIRGLELGFEEGQFIKTFHTFSWISLLSWIVNLYGLVLLWKRNFHWVYYYFGSLAFYFSLVLFLLGWQYFKEDISVFDKITFFGALFHSLFYYYAQKGSENDDEISFFD